MELVFDLSEFVREYLGLASARVDLLLYYLGSFLEYLLLLVLSLVADRVSFVIGNNALAANVDLAGFAEVLGPLVRMLEAIFLCWLLFGFLLDLFLLLGHMLLAVHVVEYGEVLDQLFDVWREIAAASWAGQHV